MTATPAQPALQSGQDVLAISPVVPVVVIDDVADAVPLAQALVRGGVRIIEITLRTAAGLGAIERVAAEVPEMVTGAGTVLSADDALAVQKAGAQFIVTPGVAPKLLDAAMDTGLPLLAGTNTLSEMLTLAERGLTAMKFFPAEASGGRPYLSAVAGPVPHLKFCPTGGVSPANAADYLALPNVGCVGGSWLTPKQAVASGDWAQIEQLASEAAALRR